MCIANIVFERAQTVSKRVVRNAEHGQGGHLVLYQQTQLKVTQGAAVASLVIVRSYHAEL